MAPRCAAARANCTVVVSDEEIGSPFVKNPTAVMAMNLPSLDKFEKLGRPGRCAGRECLDGGPGRDTG